MNLKNDLQRTALHMASVEGQAHVIERLVGYGADVNVQDIDGNTALNITLIKKSTQPLSSNTPQMNKVRVSL